MKLTHSSQISFDTFEESMNIFPEIMNFLWKYKTPENILS